MKYALPLLLLLAGCVAGPTEPVWLKPGTPALAAEQDFLACAAQARRDFPPDRRIAVSPRVTIGVGIGNRRRHGGFGYGGIGGIGGYNGLGGYGGAEVYERDGNSALRARSLDACMLAKGYGERRLPKCTARVTEQLQSQPFDTTGLCLRNGRISAPR